MLKGVQKKYQNVAYQVTYWITQTGFLQSYLRSVSLDPLYKYTQRQYLSNFPSKFKLKKRK